MRHKYTKVLTSRKHEGELPQLVIAESENMQSKFVVQKILELREQGIPLEEIAVLFRSSFLSFDLEIELSKANIPFVKFGGFKFIETAHVKDMIAYLRVLENPRDVVSWNRILLLLDGVGPRTAERVIDDILQRKASPGSAEFWQDYHGYPANVRELFGTLRDIGPARSSPGEKVARLLTYYHPLFRSRYDDYTKRKKDLEAFEQISSRYDDTAALLADLALEPPVESVADVASTGKDEERLTLSTIHSAKGLEWNTVFLITALDGRFPAMRTVDDLDELEEERRLMYVAVTRAKEHLFITYPINIYDRESGVILSKPSRFLEGLGEQLLEPWVVGEAE